MSSKTIIVKNLSPSANLNGIKKLFQMQGECEMESLGDYALVSYQTEEAALSVVQKLNNTNLLGFNPFSVSIQFYQTKPNTNQSSTKGMKAQTKFAGQGGMNVQSSKTQDRQMQIEKEQGTFSGSEHQKFKPNTMGKESKTMTMSPDFGRRTSGDMQIEYNPKLAQDIYNERFKTMAKDYMQSQPHKSKKYAALTSAYFAQEFSKKAVPVKVYSSYEEFYVDTKSMPKSAKENEKPMQIFRENKTSIEPTTLSYAELQAELRKRNVKDVKGSKQSLVYTLEKVLAEY